MKRLGLIFMAVLMCFGCRAQDIRTAYNLSHISSYVCISHVGYETVNELRDTLESLREQYHSVDFVVDVLNATGDREIDPQVISDSLEGHYQRMAFLVGPHTEHGAVNIASVLRRNDKAILVGDSAKNGLQTDIQLTSNEAYMTAWLDSLHEKHIIQKSAERFVRENREMLTKRFPTAKDLCLNYDQNAEFMEVLYDEARKVGISRNDSSFYYSGFTLHAEARAEVMKQMYPVESAYYYRCLNLPLDTAINLAKETLETSQYRKLLGVKW